MEQTTFFAEFTSDDVHCPVCLQIFVDPQSLQCLHTFCIRCVRELTECNHITCPTCRKVTLIGNTVSSFQTKRLVEAFKNQEQAALHKTNCKPKPKCNLCEESSAKSYCNNCDRLLCNICLKSHIKISTCTYEQSVKIKEHVGKLKKQLDKLSDDLQSQMANIETSSDEAVEYARRSAQEKLDLITKAESDILKRVKEWHDKQREFVINKRDENVEMTGKKSVQLLEKTSKLLSKVSEATESVDCTMDTHQPLQEEVKRELKDIKREKFELLHYSLKNYYCYEHSFNPKKAVTVEIQKLDLVPKALPETSTSGVLNHFDGRLEMLKENILHVQKVVKLTDTIWQMQFINEQLWALMQNKILVLNKHGKIVKTVASGLKEARDMLPLDSGHVLVATLHLGLLLFSQSGQLIQCLNKGRFISLARREPNDVIWALEDCQESNQAGLLVHKMKVRLYDCEKLATIHTNVESKEFTLCSAILNRSLFVTSYANHSLYEIDTVTGSILSKYGGKDSNGLANLNCPWTVYADDVSKLLLVIDCSNNKFKVFDPITSKWSVVMTTGEEFKKPTAMAADSAGVVWFACGAEATLYKGNCLEETN